ncbi:hypothetical protein MAM1_0019d01703 [Mucor ambiguus]|uniref:Uncharacterized protein n=1 Tax=Mucor ambiguus TaxID=91626 RepID=A0A0C9MGS8_9FUNG|nr:hypothetical protein MAM1_0019d01703 [Mucor ambiguus]
MATNVSFKDEDEVDAVDSKANDNDTANSVETTTFLLELRLMEAIEHEYFADMNNVQLMEPIYSYKDHKYSDTIMRNAQLIEPGYCHEKHERSDSNSNIEDNTNDGKEDMEQKLVELLLSLNLKAPNEDTFKAPKEDTLKAPKEDTLKAPKEDNTEVMLTELLFSLNLKAPAEEDVKGDEPSKDDLSITEIAAALTKLSLRVDSLDTFDRDLAVFGRDGNIVVEDSSIFSFLAKALSSQSSERELLRRLLFPEQTE